jgi:Na+/melibiose symporter-like transporter
MDAHDGVLTAAPGAGKRRKPYPYDFKTLFGFTTMSLTQVSGGVLYLYFFMVFITDYSGIDAMVGQAGFAASLATSVLLIARVVDIVDDPLQAWVMDSAKPGRLGKYRKFAFLSVGLIATSVIALFGIPGFVKSSTVWVSAGFWSST